MRDPAQLLAAWSAALLAGCATGASGGPAAQQAQVSPIAILKPGEPTPGRYQILETISAVDCSGAPAGGRAWGNAEKAIESLRQKAAQLGADAVVNVSCSSELLLHNCWSAQRCSGDAIRTEAK